MRESKSRRKKKARLKITSKTRDDVREKVIKRTLKDLTEQNVLDSRERLKDELNTQRQRIY